MPRRSPAVQLYGDRVGFLTNDNKVAWTVKTGKYDLIIRNFEKYSHDTRPLEEAAFWMLK